MTRIKKPIFFKAVIRLFCVYPWLVFVVAAQSPEILKIDPPSWWVGSSVNPVRLMIRGRNLQRAGVHIAGEGIRVVSEPKINERGTYMLVDVFIDPNAQAGSRSIKLSGGDGSTQAAFEILRPLNRT